MTSARTVRVLHVITSTSRRGAESFAVTLDEELGARGHQTSVVALTRAARPPELEVPALGHRSLGLTTLTQLRRAARQVEVVVAHGSRTLPAAVLALAGTGTPIVYVNIGDPLFWARSSSRRLRVRALLKRVRAVAALTASSRSTLIARFGLRAEDVRVIPNARRAEDFPLVDDASRQVARAELGLPSECDVVLYLGALSREKRPDVAIDAVARLGHGARLLLVGDGPIREATESRAATALGDRAVFLGTRSDVARVLSAADLLVLPSDSEGLPGVLIEAGLVGLPVVATDVGFIGDVIVDGVTGLLVPPGDADSTATAIRRALVQRQAFGRAGRRHCLAHFEMGPVIDAWEALLVSICR